jgi:chromosome segregation ATPase
MAASGVERLKIFLQGCNLLNDEVLGLLVVVTDQCHSKIQNMQEQHRSVSTKCVGLELAKVSVNEKQELLKSSVAKLEKKVAAAKKKVPTAQKRLDAAQANFDNVEQAVEDAEKEHETAKEELTELKKRVLDTLILKDLILNIQIKKIVWNGNWKVSMD